MRKRREPDALFKIREVPFDTSADFVTIPPGHDVWTSGTVGCDSLLLAAKGAFVRIQPPAEASEATVAAVVTACREAGALAVRVAPRVRTLVLPEPGTVDRSTVANFREVVQTLVKEAKTENRPALEALAEEVISEAGL